MVVSVSALDIEVGYRHRAQGAVEIGTVDVGFDVGINCGILELVCKIESGKVQSSDSGFDRKVGCLSLLLFTEGYHIGVGVINADFSMVILAVGVVFQGDILVTISVVVKLGYISVDTFELIFAIGVQRFEIQLSVKFS